MKLKSILQSCIASAIVALSLTAHADTLVANNMLPAPLSNTAWVTKDGNPFAFDSVGLWSLTNSGAADASLNGSFLGFCIEPDQAVTTAAATTGESSYTSSLFTASAPVQRLFDLYYAGARTSDTQAAPFGLALQELLLEQTGSYSLDTGTHTRAPSYFLGDASFNAQAVASANTLLADVMAAPDAATHLQIMRFSSPVSQDFLTATPMATAVPEPQSYALILGGLLALRFMSGRRRR